MRRILTLLALLALFAMMAMAADTSATDNSSATTNQAEGKPPMAKPEPLTAWGSLWEATVGEKFIRQTGIHIDFAFDAGFSINNVRNAQDNPNGVSAGGPDAEPGATGFNLSQAQMNIHRDPASNVIAGITPIPGPTPKKFDWGFQVATTYGSDGLPCDIAGWDTHWGVNEPGATNLGTPKSYTTGRQNYLCTPMVHAIAYLPFWKGMEVMFGRIPSGIGFEIPPDVPWPMGPNFFDSHLYSAYSDMMENFGVMAAVNVMRSQKNGYLEVDFGATNGQQTFPSAAGKPFQNFLADVRWRAPHMNTWIDYETTFGPNNVAVNAAGQQLNSTNFGAAAMSTQIQSPTNQTEWRNALVLQHEFGKKWKLAVEGAYGKQYSDGMASTTVLATAQSFDAPLAVSICGAGVLIHETSCPFPGSSYTSEDATLTYQINRKTAWGVRVEHFNGGDGEWLFPINAYVPTTGADAGFPVAVGGAVNDITFGINYKPVKFVTLRPELRYDWQSGNWKNADGDQVNMFSGGNCTGVTNCPTSRTQVTATLNAVFWF